MKRLYQYVNATPIYRIVDFMNELIIMCVILKKSVSGHVLAIALLFFHSFHKKEISSTSRWAFLLLNA